MKEHTTTSSILHSLNDTTHYFAVSVKRILTLSALGMEASGKDGRAEYRTHQWKRQTDFLNCLMNPRDERMTFDLRFIAEPDPTLYTRGRVRCALVCAAREMSATEAERFACELFRLLQASFEEYVIELVGTDDVAGLLEPFPITHVTAITRRSAWARLDTLGGEPRRKRLGFGDAAGATSPQRGDAHSVFHLFPFVSAVEPFNGFLKLLLLQPSPMLVSCRLQPTSLRAGEESFFQQQIARCESFVQAARLAESEDWTNLRPVLIQQAQAYRQLQERLLWGLHDNAALMTVQVAAPAAIPAGVSDTLGSLITTAAGAFPEKNASVPMNYLKGGYEVMDLSQVTTAKKSVASLEMTLPPQKLATKEVQRLPHLFDSLEAACAFRLPPATMEAPLGLEAQTWRSVPAPKELPDAGCLLGVSNHGGVRQLVRLGDEDRKRHAYLVGQTGTGKTTAMRTMILEDMRAGRGVCVIDPHGDLFKELLERVPVDRLDDVVLLDPTDTDYPVGLNMLECDSEEQCHFIAQEWVAMITRLMIDEYGPAGREMLGPVFFQHTRMNMLLAMSDPDCPGTLLEYYLIYLEKDYWKRWTQPLKSSDPLLKRWVENVLPRINYPGPTSDGTSMGSYIGSKIEGFVFDPKLRLIFNQRRSTIDFPSVMNRGKILLVNLAKGTVGETNAKFVGMILMAKLMASAMSRVKLPENQRREFNIYVDEFQSIATTSFTTLLSEARKFGVSLVLANQFIAQVREKHPDIVHAIFGNVGTSICFRLGLADAELMEREFHPTFSQSDLSNLPNWHAYVSTLVNNQTIRPFSMQTVLPDGAPDPKIAERARALSRKKYARPRKEVEAEIETSLLQQPQSDENSSRLREIF